MKISIRSYLDEPPRPGEREVCERHITENRCSIGELLEELSVDVVELGMVLVNRHRVSKEYRLQDGDVVTLIPFLGGG